MSRLHTIQQRYKKIDINQLNPDQIVALSASVGKEVASIMKEAKDKIESFLGVYGLQLNLQYSVGPKEDKNKVDAQETTEKTD